MKKALYDITMEELRAERWRFGSTQSTLWEDSVSMNDSLNGRACSSRRHLCFASRQDLPGNCEAPRVADTPAVPELTGPQTRGRRRGKQPATVSKQDQTLRCVVDAGQEVAAGWVRRFVKTGAGGAGPILPPLGTTLGTVPALTVTVCWLCSPTETQQAQRGSESHYGEMGVKCSSLSMESPPSTVCPFRIRVLTTERRGRLSHPDGSPGRRVSSKSH